MKERARQVKNDSLFYGCAHIFHNTAGSVHSEKSPLKAPHWHSGRGNCGLLKYVPTDSQLTR